MRKSIADFADEPVYNMKAVEQQTGISAATLRAWERRYGLVEPRRTPNGYRLYSDRDVALLHWVHDRMLEGLTVSRVVAMLESMRASGEALWIDDAGAASAPVPARDIPLPPASLARTLYSALVELDDERADEVMEQAFAMYTLPTVAVEIIAPTLVEVGEAWHRGEVLIATEHFATTYLRGRLLALLQTYPHRADMPTIFIGCAPYERHEIGALIFAVMLRQQGYNIVYLGQDTPVEDLLKAVLQEKPAMICLSASHPNSALALRGVQAALESAAPPHSLFGYGGRAFDKDADLRNQVRGHYLGPDPREAINRVNSLVKGRR